MATFPRIKKFTFQIERFYQIPGYLTGRMDLISLELYNNIKMYKPLAAANNMRNVMGTRYGIRQTVDALRNELVQAGVSDANLDAQIDSIMDNKRLNAFDWYGYENITSGYITDAYEGRVLQVPTFESANRWLNQYQFIQLSE